MCNQERTDLAFAASTRDVWVDDGASGLRESPVSSAVALAEGLRSLTGAIFPGMRPFTWHSSTSAIGCCHQISIYGCQLDR